MSRPQTKLFAPLQIRTSTARNRLWASPACHSSAVDGLPQRWHLVHLGSFAMGGAGLVMAESIAVAREGRRSSGCAGIWNDEHAAAWAKVATFIRQQGALAAVQLTFAGRGVPARTPGSTARMVALFADAARRSESAGFAIVEIDSSRGGLIQEFLSPASNRTDSFGGSYANRVRLLLDIVVAVRAALSESTGLFVRLSVTNEHDGGWSCADTAHLIPLLERVGVDLVNFVSPEPGDDRRGSPHGMSTAAAHVASAVGPLATPREFEDALAGGHADAVFAGRAFLRDRMLPTRAAFELSESIDGTRAWAATDVGAVATVGER